MSDLSQEEILKQINELLNQAEEEECKYNWNKEIKILKKIEKIILDNKLKEIEAELYYKLGEIYQIAAEYERTENKILERFQLSISSFQRAYNIFKDLKIEGKINASKGFINFLKYITISDEEKEEDLLKLAKRYFNKASLIFLKKGDLIDSLKMKILESRALELIIGEKLIRIDEHANYIELTIEYENLIKDVWDEIKNQPSFSEIYIYQFFISIMDFSNWIITYLPVENFNIKKFINYIQDKIKEIINFFESSKKNVCLFYAYAIYSYLNLLFVVHFINSQFEQKKYLKIAQKWLQKGEILLPKINGNASLAVFYYTRYTSAFFLISLGYITKDFKKILDDFDLSVESISLCLPKIAVAHMTFYAAFSFIVGALSRSIPNIQRIDFAKKALNLIESLTKVPVVKDRNYKIFNLTKDVYLSAANAILGDSIKEKKEITRHLELAFKNFNRISDYRNPKIENTYFYYHGFLWTASRTGILLAKNSSNTSKKVNFYLKAIDFLFESKKMLVAITQIENLFFIGSSYYKVGILTNDDQILKKSYHSYIDAIDYCKNKGYFNLLGSAYVNLAQIDDRLGNFLSAAENYKKAINSFDKAILTLTYTNLGRRIEKLKNYMNAWNIIETAKSYHTNEDHYNAQLNYEQASRILKDLREYKFESPFYFAWSILEKAEHLSKQNKHQEAAATYLVSKNNFQDAIESIKIDLSKRKTSKEKDRISKLIKVAEVRANYCNARYQIENARLESKKGNYLLASELYNKAGSIFENLCKTFKIKRERQELIGIYYLCKAWEHMEQANLEQESSSYTLASDLFEKACHNFPESRMKKLSLGNSYYCSALEFGVLFDKSTDLEKKVDCYKKIKMYLREASKNYQMGGFQQDAQWALATSTFFDGIWHLILSDNEIDFSKKNQYLNIATKYLNNALNIFDASGYGQKRDEVSNYLEMINDEKKILTSALNIIEKPAISESSIGISAPSCPIEISSSVNISEMQRTDLQTESELDWHKRIHHIYFIMPNGISIYDHSFNVEEEVEPQLVAGGLTGITALIQEVTKSQTNVKIVEQEEMIILLEHGKYLTGALITEENLITLRNKLIEIIKEIEDFFQEELESYSGNLSVFSKISKFVQKIFET